MSRLRSAGPGRGSRPRVSDEGNAIVEFVYLAVLLMVPLVYLVLTVLTLERAAFGVTAATREAGRAYVTAGDDADGRTRALTAARLALADQGLDLGTDELQIRCSADPCLTPGASVDVRIDVAVALPGLPAVFCSGQGADRSCAIPASVAVHGRHTEQVARFRDAAPASDHRESG